MKLESLNLDIKTLKLDSAITEKLNQVNIYFIKDLWTCTKTFLKENNFNNFEISKIKISLQLMGLDLNKKVY